MSLLRIIDLPLGWTVVLDTAAWAVVGVAVGYGMHRVPAARLAHDGPLTRLRPFEADGRWYERRLHIKTWKARLPEAGALFEGGFSKRALDDSSLDHLERFVVETRRAELTHWLVLAAGVPFVLWNPPGLLAVMWLYAVVANVPCLLIQRYNRARLTRVLDRARRRRDVNAA
jgi:glycosyl-4,4'-diaponeurosporenoate acyltransferase